MACLTYHLCLVSVVVTVMYLSFICVVIPIVCLALHSCLVTVASSNCYVSVLSCVVIPMVCLALNSCLVSVAVTVMGPSNE